MRKIYKETDVSTPKTEYIFIEGEYHKARIIATVAAAGLAALVGCKGTQEKEKDFKVYYKWMLPRENSPYVGMNEQNLQIQCGSYSSACYMMPEDKRARAIQFGGLGCPMVKAAVFFSAR